MSIGRFRSTSLFAPRVRAVAPTVDRATFVIFSVGGHRFAAAVESVERVLRGSAAADKLQIGGASFSLADLAVADLAGALRLTAAPSAESRALVLSGYAAPVVVEVDRVWEVATIDAATVDAVGSVPSGALVTEHGGREPSTFPGARGVFTRHETAVIVLDLARALDASTAGAHASATGSRLSLSV